MTNEVWVVVAFNMQPHRPPAVVIRGYWDEAMAEGEARDLRRRYTHVHLRKVQVAPVGM